jgi:MSHA pilin protein MshC
MDRPGGGRRPRWEAPRGVGATTPFFFARGFTLVELVMAMLVLVVLAAVALPRFLGGEGTHSLGFAEELRAALRYAQRSAMAMQRTVCVSFAAQSATLTYASAYGAAVCDRDLPGPSGSPVPFRVTATGGAGFAALPANFSFDRAGRPSTGQVITLTGARPIRVEPQTGYVY